MAHKETAALIDGLLKTAVFTGVVGVGFVAPNTIQALDKPLRKLLKHLDHNAQIRETQRAIRYMKQQGLIRGDYDHGLQITDKGRLRLERRAASLVDVVIEKPDRWDGTWRLVMYDIPEQSKSGRNALTVYLKDLGFHQLQRSVWIYPYPCRQQIELVSSHYAVDGYVTYLESNLIDNQSVLIDRFKQRNIM